MADNWDRLKFPRYTIMQKVKKPIVFTTRQYNLILKSLRELRKHFCKTFCLNFNHTRHWKIPKVSTTFGRMDLSQPIPPPIPIYDTVFSSSADIRYMHLKEPCYTLLPPQKDPCTTTFSVAGFDLRRSPQWLTSPAGEKKLGRKRRLQQSALASEMKALTSYRPPPSFCSASAGSLWKRYNLTPTIVYQTQQNTHIYCSYDDDSRQAAVNTLDSQSEVVSWKATWYKFA